MPADSCCELAARGELVQRVGSIAHPQLFVLSSLEFPFHPITVRWSNSTCKTVENEESGTAKQERSPSVSDPWSSVDRQTWVLVMRPLVLSTPHNDEKSQSREIILPYGSGCHIPGFFGGQGRSSKIIGSLRVLKVDVTSANHHPPHTHGSITSIFHSSRSIPYAS